MCDDLEDLEMESFSFPNISIENDTQNIEFKKRLQERKLVEESDLAIARRLFRNDEEYNEEYNEEKKYNEYTTNPIKDNQKDNQYKNEFKQKELVRVKREKKAKETKHIELYGKCVEDEYSYYEDKFNS